MRKIEAPPTWDLLVQNINEFISGLSDLELKESLNKISDQYLYWDKIKHYKTKVSSERLWGIVKLSRKIHSKPISIGEFKFTYNVTDYMQKQLHLFDMHIGGTMSTNSIIPEDDKNQYLISSIMEEAIASSQIEGAITTRKQAKEMLRKRMKPKNKSEQMIYNNYETIKHIVDIKNEPITIEKLFEIHRLITNKTMDDFEDEGKYRDNSDVNVIDAIDGEIVHTPPNHNRVPVLMEELFKFFNSEKDEHFIHPIIKASIIHFMIGYVHPFVDGNGRTARALFYWYLLKNGYWLTEYLSISRLIVKSKTKYALAYLYSETDDNDLTYFINYKIRTMRLAFDGLRQYIERKIKEKKRVIHFNKIKGVNERQALILNWINTEGDLLLTVKEVETRMNISNQTARTDLIGLEKLKLLESTDLNKRTRGYFKSSRFDILTKGFKIEDFQEPPF